MERRGGFGCSAIDFHFRLESGGGGGDSATEAAAAESGDDGGDIRQVFEDFEADGGVAGDEVVVFEGVNEGSVEGGMAAFDDGGPAFVHGGFADAGAEALDGVE